MLISGPVIGMMFQLWTVGPGTMVDIDMPDWRDAYIEAKRDPKAFCAALQTLSAISAASREHKPDGPVDADVFLWNNEELTCPRNGTVPVWRMDAAWRQTEGRK